MGQDGLGVGLVWWPALDALCHPGESLVDVVEIEPETWWIPLGEGRGFRSHAPDVARRFSQPVILHGVGAPLGGACPPPARHDEVLARDIAAIGPALVTEHLSLTHFRPTSGDHAVFAGVMLPPMQSAAGLALAAGNIARHRAALGGAPFAIEAPVNYLPPSPGEWPDGLFMARLAEAADCGILLDLHNILCNARNGRQSVEAYCAQLPLERVWELHIAGGEAKDGFWLDAHSGPAEPEVMEIAAALTPKLPALRAIVLEILPERVSEKALPIIADQLRRLREIWRTRGTACESTARPRGTQQRCRATLDPTGWERLLGSELTGVATPPLDETWMAWRHDAARALDLYRSLANEGRASSVAVAAPRCTRLLLDTCGSEGARAALAQYWRQAPPAYTVAQEGAGFIGFLAAHGPALPGFAEAAAEDLARMTPVGMG